MKKAKRTILGVHVAQRTRHTAKVQKILSDYGCSIRTRIGLHEAGAGFCSLRSTFQPGALRKMEANPSSEPQ